MWLYGLAYEYWHPQILVEIGGAIGSPIALDENTVKKTFGHYARILVDFDLNNKLLKQILVERKGLPSSWGWSMKRFHASALHVLEYMFV